jgi:hypothetical protein
LSGDEENGANKNGPNPEVSLERVIHEKEKEMKREILVVLYTHT